MSYFSNVEPGSSLEGLGCGPECNCGPCKSGMSGLAEWYEKEEARGATESVPAPTSAPRPAALGEAPPRPRVCDNKSIPVRDPVRPRPLTAARSNCTPRNAFGRTDPFDVLGKAIARAIEMLDNTIGELVNARQAVCAGAAPGGPLLRVITIDWLRNRLGVCVDDIRVWTAGTFVNRSIAEIIRRLMRVRNLIASNGLRYSCNSPRCEPSFWAFVIARDAAGKCLPGTPQMLIRLCRNFWLPGVDTHGVPVDPAVHAEFQAQTIIHEASHLTHCNAPERVGHTIGVAECLAQFVAATNGSPLDDRFRTSCATTTRCGGAMAGEAAAAQSRIAGLGFSGPSSFKILGTSFRPRNAVRLKGRPALRRSAKQR